MTKHVSERSHPGTSRAANATRMTGTTKKTFGEAKPVARRLNAVWWRETSSARAPAPPLVGEEDADVLIVGGGLAGLATAWKVAKRDPGRAIAIVDANVAGEGSSDRNAGMIETVFAAPLWLVEESLPAGEARFALTELVRRIGEATHALATTGIDCDLAPSTCVLGAPDAMASQIVRSIAEQLQASDITHDRADAEDARARWGLQGRGAVTTPGWSVNPRMLVDGLRRTVLSQGARLFEKSRVVSLEVDLCGGFRAVSDRGGTMRAREVVLATSAETGDFALMPDRPYEVRHTAMFATDPLPDDLMAELWSDRGANIAELSLSAQTYFRLYRDRLLFGAFGERVKSVDQPVDGRLARALADAMRTSLPWLPEVGIDAAWGGPITMNLVDLPLIGPIDGVPGAWTLGGNSSCGLPWCLVGAEMVAALMTDGAEADPDLERLRRATQATRVPWGELAWLGMGWGLSAIAGR